jgi:hypothetical protein
MPRIAWVEDKDATGQLAHCYDTLKAMNPFGDGKVPDVFRAMSQRPEFLAGVMGILPVQFSGSTSGIRSTPRTCVDCIPAWLGWRHGLEPEKKGQFQLCLWRQIPKPLVPNLFVAQFRLDIQMGQTIFAIEVSPCVRRCRLSSKSLVFRSVLRRSVIHDVD